MSIELIGERAYSDSIRKAQGVWILMEDRAIYVLKENQGNALATWASQADADTFSQKVEDRSLKSAFFPLSSLLHSILNNDEYKVVSVLASPRYGVPALTYSKSEFLSEFNT